MEARQAGVPANQMEGKGEGGGVNIGMGGWTERGVTGEMKKNRENRNLVRGQKSIISMYCISMFCFSNQQASGGLFYSSLKQDSVADTKLMCT